MPELARHSSVSGSAGPSPSSTDMDGHVSLRTAVAMTYGEDLEAGLAALDASVALARHSPLVRRMVAFKSIALQVGLPLALVGLVIAGAALFGDLLPTPVFGLVVLLVAIPPVILILWHCWQYGIGFPASPRSLAHPADARIEFAFAQVQKESGPPVFRRVSFGGRLERVDRHVFFGRLRYLLLCEDLGVRRQVSGFPLRLRMAGDLFLARADAECLKALARPKRRGGPGRDPKYAYVEAVIATLSDPAISGLDLADQTGAIRMIEKQLAEWFEEHIDESGAVPRKDLIRPYAIKIFEGLILARTTR